MDTNYILSQLFKANNFVQSGLPEKYQIRANKTTKINQLGLDSIDYVEFIMEIEKELNFAIPDDKVEVCLNKSFLEVAEFIHGLMNEK